MCIRVVKTYRDTFKSNLRLFSISVPAHFILHYRPLSNFETTLIKNPISMFENSLRIQKILRPFDRTKQGKSSGKNTPTYISFLLLKAISIDPRRS